MHVRNFPRPSKKFFLQGNCSRRHVKHNSHAHITRDTVTGIRPNVIVLVKFAMVTGFFNDVIMCPLSFLCLISALATTPLRALNI